MDMQYRPSDQWLSPVAQEHRRCLGAVRYLAGEHNASVDLAAADGATALMLAAGPGPVTLGRELVGPVSGSGALRTTEGPTSAPPTPPFLAGIWILPTESNFS